MSQPNGTVRFAVVGLGHIAQVAVLPAFRNAENAELAALVSGDARKRDALGERYGVPAVDYDGYDRLLESGGIDAVYIAIPNHLHRDYAVRAAERGVHVLCEKPMAVTEEECEAMIAAAREHDVRLMVAYRLHFEEANMAVVDAARGGELGTLRYFTSSFSQDVKAGDVRLVPTDQGGGPIYDMGVYCINAARYLFRAEPIQVSATTAARDDPRFRECEETASVVLRFPGERLAAFTVGFGATDVSEYRLTGTAGAASMDPAYTYAAELTYEITSGGETRRRTLPKRDQFAPQLVHLSRCVLEGETPGPDGEEGLLDVRVVEAIYQSVARGRPVDLEPARRDRRPGPEQTMRRPGFEKPEEVRASGPSD